jgi:hypothetical protein
MPNRIRRRLPHRGQQGGVQTIKTQNCEFLQVI